MDLLSYDWRVGNELIVDEGSGCRWRRCADAVVGSDGVDTEVKGVECGEKLILEGKR